VKRRVSVTLVVTLTLGVLTLGSSVTSAAAVCSACHGQHADVVAEGAHADVGCYGCHLDAGAWSWPGAKTREWLGMYPAALGGTTPRGPGIETAAAACISCHAETYERASEARGLRVVHESCAQGVTTCDECHGAVAHGEAIRWIRQVDMERCVSCHEERGADRECDTCHEGKRTAERLSAGPWQVTHGPQWRTTHGMGSLKHCDTCHPDDHCVKCHGVSLPHGAAFGRTHGAEALGAAEQCRSCHEDPALCDDCHGMVMPHPAGFLQAHGESTEELDDPRCAVCHRGDCLPCHERHVHPARTDGTLGKPPSGTIDPSGAAR
jgi:hypothetical protein